MAEGYKAEVRLPDGRVAPVVRLEVPQATLAAYADAEHRAKELLARARARYGGQLSIEVRVTHSLAPVLTGMGRLALAAAHATRVLAEGLRPVVAAAARAEYELAEAAYLRHYSRRLPGSTRTARLRKKRRTRVLQWYQQWLHTITQGF